MAPGKKKTWGDKTVEVIGTSVRSLCSCGHGLTVIIFQGSSGIQTAAAIHPKIKRIVNFARGRTWISPVFGTGSTLASLGQPPCVLPTLTHYDRVPL
jgi:hypothetical protein